jgi:alpha-D-ribose 1-methylphosphonate 5-triphosphate synthase subunit PhnH
MMSSNLTAGFAAPVTDSQVTFRTLLDAMAHPGKAHKVAALVPPEPLNQAAAAAVLTLVDHETPVWIDPAASAAAPWIAFHTGAPRAERLDRCAFALALTLPDLTALSQGTDEAPETSASVILQVAAVDRGRRYRLTGPGLRAPEVIAIDGLPADFPAIWQRNRAGFPCGIDLILCAGDRLAALPRSVSIEEV